MQVYLEWYFKLILFSPIKISFSCLWSDPFFLSLFDFIIQLLFSDYQVLKDHFRSDHYLCEEGDCFDAEFTNAFRTDIDFKGHQAQYHSKATNKLQSRQERKLNIDINLAPRPNSRPHRGRSEFAILWFIHLHMRWFCVWNDLSDIIVTLLHFCAKPLTTIFAINHYLQKWILMESWLLILKSKVWMQIRFRFWWIDNLTDAHPVKVVCSGTFVALVGSII